MKLMPCTPQQGGHIEPRLAQQELGGPANEVEVSEPGAVAVLVLIVLAYIGFMYFQSRRSA